MQYSALDLCVPVPTVSREKLAKPPHVLQHHAKMVAYAASTAPALCAHVPKVTPVPLVKSLLARQVLVKMTESVKTVAHPTPVLVPLVSVAPHVR